MEDPASGFLQLAVPAAGSWPWGEMEGGGRTPLGRRWGRWCISPGAPPAFPFLRQMAVVGDPFSFPLERSIYLISAGSD